MAYTGDLSHIQVGGFVGQGAGIFSMTSVVNFISAQPDSAIHVQRTLRNELDPKKFISHKKEKGIWKIEKASKT